MPRPTRLPARPPSEWKGRDRHDLIARNLTVKAGRFFGEFGRLSYIHDQKGRPFVFRPIVLDAYIGGESRTDGVQVNWLLPFKHYVSLTRGWVIPSAVRPTKSGTSAVLNGLNFWSRLSTYF